MKKEIKKKMIFVLYAISLLISIILALVLFFSVTKLHKCFIPSYSSLVEKSSDSSSSQELSIGSR